MDVINKNPVFKKLIPLAFVALTVGGVLLVAGMGFHWFFTGSKPVQPIAFSHNLHMEKVGLECSFCHPYTDRSSRAGLPAVGVCMDCHESVAVDKGEIKKLKHYWDKKEPIPWIKVHVQPWHVYYNHKRHIKVGFECTYCHGDVKVMDAVRKVRSLEMGWCVNCHRKNNASTDCLVCHK